MDERPARQSGSLSGRPQTSRRRLAMTRQAVIPSFIEKINEVFINKMIGLPSFNNFIHEKGIGGT